MPILLGAVADDFTGATDLCNTLVKEGMRTIQLIGTPADGELSGDVDAVVVALKIRTVAPEDAVARALEACRFLRQAGAVQILSKYCSTFDSTERGNIGPIADALLDELKGDLALVCPAFPEAGRTIYMGNLFVGEVPLAESSMRHHPLTPMRDSNLIRVMTAQSRYEVGLVPLPVVAKGVDAVLERLATLREQGHRYAVADVVEDRHLRTLGRAAAGHPLVTGGSGIALGLPDNFRAAGKLAEAGEAAALPAIAGPAAVLAGSCSAATLKQVAEFERHRPALKLDPATLTDGDAVGSALAWAQQHIGDGPVLVYASAPPDEVTALQEKMGREAAGALVERTMAGIAQGLVEAGVKRLVVAGGETSGSVVEALGITGLRIGAQIDPGVPACVTIGRHELALALKSGNFGRESFFLHALEVMP